jgi:competence protein ComEC
MTRTNWIIIGLAYIIGLLSTNVIINSASGLTLKQLVMVSAIFTGLAILLAIILRIGFMRSGISNYARQVLQGAIAQRTNKIVAGKIKTHVWIMAVMVAIFAVGYFQLRIPQPQYNDISYQISKSDRLLVHVKGTVLNEPRLNDRQRLKFWLKVAQVEGEKVSGKLYATLPLLQGTGIYPGQQLNLTGFLYLPPAASNPQGFDFKQYLARQGIFAGIQGTEAKFKYDEPGWGWWKLRQRIVWSHLQGLGSPVGQLVSSMVLGSKAVDLPTDIRDRFIAVGLAHVLAASGFQTSLLLGLILKLTERMASKSRLVIGIGTLITYLGLTGIQASVLRACLMGVAVLLALTMDTKVKPLGSLFLAAVIILLLDPLLINDLGFQLSFLATLGLIVTLPKLQAKLDWLPITIASLVAVPLAASIWVLPLLCYEFNTLATYSIAVNILSTPLITVISLGGMISAIATLIVPAIGSAIASWLFYPTTFLINITEFCSNLPGNTWAVGQIPQEMLLAIYGLFILIWFSKWWQRRWWLGLIFPVILIITTAIYNSAQIQIAVLATPRSPIIVIQDQSKVILINSGQNNQAKYSLLPFLAQQGINTIDYGLAYDHSSNSSAEWLTISQRVHTKTIFSPEANNSSALKTILSSSLPEITTKSAHLTMDRQLSLINLQIADCNWLIIGKPANTENLNQKIEDYIKQHHLTSQHPIIVFSEDITSRWLELLQPKMAIASTDQITLETKQILQQKQIEFHNTVVESVIRWTPNQGIIQAHNQLN